jgi:PIN domain nuclease of toxin-antitoxin system
MMFLDTHVVVWLYAGEVDRLPAEARRMIEEQDLLISPMVILELQYLRETGRLTVEAHRVVAALAKTLGLQTCEWGFSQVILEALAQVWTRDPFDRIIVAHASARNLPLLTKDDVILANYKKAFWSTPLIPKRVHSKKSS